MVRIKHDATGNVNAWTARLGNSGRKTRLGPWDRDSRLIAWGIAKAAREAGAELAFTYQGELLEKRIRPLAQELGAKIVGDCDVTDTAALDAVIKEIERVWKISTLLCTALLSPTKIS